MELETKDFLKLEVAEELLVEFSLRTEERDFERFETLKRLQEQETKTQYKPNQEQLAARLISLQVNIVHRERSYSSSKFKPNLH